MTRLNWKLVAGFAIVTTVIAWLLAVTKPDQYRASATAAIAPLPAGLAAGEFLRGVEVLERRTVVVTVAALASTPASRAQVGAAADDVIEAVILPNTNLVRVDVAGPDPARAAAVANRVPAVLHAQAVAMFKYYGVTMVSRAATPTAPYLPRPRRAIAAGALVGLFLGLIAAYGASRRKPARTTPR